MGEVPGLLFSVLGYLLIEEGSSFPHVIVCPGGYVWQLATNELYQISVYTTISGWYIEIVSM